MDVEWSFLVKGKITKFVFSKQRGMGKELVQYQIKVDSKLCDYTWEELSEERAA